jgi:hypothetical protein
MNTKQIENLVRSDCNLSTTFDGVYASDRIPIFCDPRTAMVLNTDPHDRAGEHWVAMYINNGVGEYFDSFGMQPRHAHFTNFLRRNCSLWTYNDTLFQSLDSDVCGYYCIWFLGERARGKSMMDIKAQFSKNTEQNDTLVKNRVEERYGAIVEQFAGVAGEGQYCCRGSDHCYKYQCYFTSLFH